MRFPYASFILVILQLITFSAYSDNECVLGERQHKSTQVGMSVMFGEYRFVLPYTYEYVLRNDGSGYFNDSERARKYDVGNIMLGVHVSELKFNQSREGFELFGSIDCTYKGLRVRINERELFKGVPLKEVYIYDADGRYVHSVSTNSAFWKELLASFKKIKGSGLSSP